MSISKCISARVGLLALIVGSLAGCGGGGGGGGAPAGGGGGGGGGGTGLPAAITAAAALPNNGGGAANLSSPNTPFTIVQGANLPAVSVNSKPDLHFVVLHNGHPVHGLTAANVSVMMSQFVPASADTTGGPDRWIPLTTRRTTNVAADANYGNAAAVGTTYWQGNPDPKIGGAMTTVTYDAVTHLPSAVNAADTCTTAGHALITDATKQLEEDPANPGYYTYHFCTDVTTTPDVNYDMVTNAQTVGAAAWNPASIHRVAVQLTFPDPSDATKFVVGNPWFDFTIDTTAGNVGNSIAAANPHKVADTASCNECHSAAQPSPLKLTAHGSGTSISGGRIDVQYCIMCHNTGSADQHSGNKNITMANMIHKFHAGSALNNNYQVHGSIAKFKTSAGYPNANGVAGATGNYGITYPQKLANCVKCHNSTTAPQAVNFKNVPSKNACFSCHDDYATTANSAHRNNAGVTISTANKKTWQDHHAGMGAILDLANPLNNRDGLCVGCHSDSVPAAAAPVSTVHAIPEWTKAASYKGVIDGVTYSGTDPNRVAVIEFHVEDATGTAYDLLSTAAPNTYNTQRDAGVSGGASTNPVTRNYRFGGLNIMVAWDAATDYLNVGMKGKNSYLSSCTVSGTQTGTSVYSAPACTVIDAAATATSLGMPTSVATAASSGFAAGDPQQTGYDSGTSALDKTVGAPANTPTGSVFRSQPMRIIAIFDSTLARKAGTTNHFTVNTSTLPAASTFSQSNVTMAVALIGSVKEAGPKDAQDTLPLGSYTVLIDNDVKYYALKGTATARRAVVSSSQCNTCHGKYINGHGHGGSRTDTQVCVMCHNAGLWADAAATAATVGTVYDAVAGTNVSAWGTTITGVGLDLTAAGDVTDHSYMFKHKVHQWHDELNAQPFTGLNRIKFPGDLTDCRTCHVNSSYLTDKGVLGSSTGGRVIATAVNKLSLVDINPLDNPVISPKATTCSGCHDTQGAQTHMMFLGGAAFLTNAANAPIVQNDFYTGTNKVFEACDGCHTDAGAMKPVGTVHAGLSK